MFASPTFNRVAAVLIVALTFVTPACASHGESASSASASPSRAGQESPLPAESNPPGDISDSQAFVQYISRDGYSLDTPEGWASSARHPKASFIDKFDGLSVVVSAKPDSLASIEATARAGRDFKARGVTLPTGKAIEISYTSNSEPDAVTEKQIRLENVAIIMSIGAKSATLRLWAPLGADNVDQWKRIEKSFRFR